MYTYSQGILCAVVCKTIRFIVLSQTVQFDLYILITFYVDSNGQAKITSAIETKSFRVSKTNSNPKKAENSINKLMR